jgi:ABC-type sugar transport system substrate-binding protein
MRRSITGLATVAVAAVLALTACSSGKSGSPAAGGGSGSSTAKVLSAANIDSVIKAYSGKETEFPQTFGTATKGAVKIGWSSPRTANELVGRLGTAIQKDVAAMGGSFTSYDANGDVATQVSQVQQLVNDHVDALIVWPLDATALKPSFKLAKAAGIPILAMEATPDGSADIGDVTGQVIYGRDIDAYVAATLMSQVSPGGQVAVAKFAVPVPSINYYAERAA